jgi:hypothetical protein
MTCVAGLVADGKVWLGGDRAAVGDGHYLSHVAQPKVFRRGSLLFGYTSSFRMGQLLQYRLSVPERPAEQPIDEFMATAFVDAVRTCLRDGNWTKFKDAREEVGCFLVGYEGHLFTFDDDCNIHRTIPGYDVVGSGISVARGSLHATAKMEISPRQRLLWALEAAQEHTTTVRAPFDIICEDTNAATEAAPVLKIA